MPIKVQNDLPARAILESENIFVMDENRAMSQDIRPLQILILNLMPIKEDTETQLLRALSNTPLQVDCTFLMLSTHVSKNTSASHLNKFYVTFDEIRRQKFDGMIITGAPVETVPFEEVDYWPELCEIMEWSKTHVFSTMHVCWGAQAALYYHFGIQKRLLPQKLSGIFEHRVVRPSNPLVRGFDEVFYAPHSRYTGIDKADVDECIDLRVLAESKEAGVYLLNTDSGRQIFVTGHPEYDKYTLDGEYRRDINKGLDIQPPKNYYPNDDPNREPIFRWRAHAHLLYHNWLNYYVYQNTPYDLKDLTGLE